MCVCIRSSYTNFAFCNIASEQIISKVKSGNTRYLKRNEDAVRVPRARHIEFNRIDLLRCREGDNRKDRKLLGVVGAREHVRDGKVVREYVPADDDKRLIDLIPPWKHGVERWIVCRDGLSGQFARARANVRH